MNKTEVFYLTIYGFRRCHGLVLSSVDNDFGIVVFVILRFRDVGWGWFEIFRLILDDTKCRWLSFDVRSLVIDSDLPNECDPLTSQLVDFRGRNWLFAACKAIRWKLVVFLYCWIRWHFKIDLNALNEILKRMWTIFSSYFRNSRLENA
jgi:hypothetical protein